MKDRGQIEERKQKLIEMTTGFCDAHLDEDYGRLCGKLIGKMARKRNVPFLTGRMEIWAAAVIYAIGQINFLFDQRFEPYVSAQEISNYFGTSKSTVSQKAKLIRDMFKMRYWDREFSTTEMREDNPLSDMVMVNGLMVSLRSLPSELQEIIRQGQKRG